MWVGTELARIYLTTPTSIEETIIDLLELTIHLLLPILLSMTMIMYFLVIAFLTLILIYKRI